MDPVTQGLLGAAVSQTALQKTIHRRSWIVGGVAAISPDLDIFIRSSQDPLLFYIYHRHFTHSLVFIPIGSFIVACCFLSLFPSYRKQWACIMLASFLGYATHGLLDACTIYGTLLYWPFSNARIAWDFMPIIDPLFTLCLFCGVIWTALTEETWAVKLGLSLAMLYLAFNIWMHHRAATLQQRLIHARHHAAQKVRVLPVIGNVFTWKSLYIWNNRIYIDTLHISLSQKSNISQSTSLNQTQEKNLPQSIKQSTKQLRDFRVFRWFANGYVTTVHKMPYTVADARYAFKLSPPRFLWGIRFPNNPKQHISWVNMIPKNQQ